MLTSEKPPVPKRLIREFQKTKWERAQQIILDLKNLGLDIIIFEASKETPHLRSNNTDYWPATQRFYDRDFRLWGKGENEYKSHVINKATNPSAIEKPKYWLF